MMMCEDGMGAEHMFSKQDGERERRKRKCVGHFRCRSAMKGLSKEGRERWRREVIGFANASTYNYDSSAAVSI